MTLTEIQDLLQKTSALRADRETAAVTLGNDKEHCRLLLQLAKEGDRETQIKACWILEIVLLRYPELLAPLRTAFFQALKTLQHPSAIRPMAKVIAAWTEANAKQATSAFPILAPSECHLLSEHCFSWLLDQFPVAVKVHSMEALFHLGEKIDWIHPELRDYLQTAYAEASPGFKARARKLLKRL